MQNFTHASLFSGIGGFDLAAIWCGWENIFQVENDEFCQKVLTKHFPQTTKYLDIKDFNGKEYENAISVISGGFPCQPFSYAGKRKGVADKRYLWKEMLRVISDVKPLFVVAENVCGLLTMQDGVVFGQIISDLENQNYEVVPFVIPASSQNAPHIRSRVFIIAHAKSGDARWNLGETERRQAQQFRSSFEQGNFAHANNTSAVHEVQTGGNLFASHFYESNFTHAAPIRCRKLELQHKKTVRELRGSTCKEWATHWAKWQTQPTICGDNDGLPRRLDKNRVKRLKALGNAVVPQVVYQIFQAIEKTSLF